MIRGGSDPGPLVEATIRILTAPKQQGSDPFVARITDLPEQINGCRIVLFKKYHCGGSRK